MFGLLLADTKQAGGGGGGRSSCLLVFFFIKYRGTWTGRQWS